MRTPIRLGTRPAFPDMDEPTFSGTINSFLLGCVEPGNVLVQESRVRLPGADVSLQDVPCTLCDPR